MKKTTILIVFMIFALGQSIAQKGAAQEVTIEQRAENQAQKLNKQLLLSPEQYTNVHELILANLKQIDYLNKEMKNKQGEESQTYRKNTLRKLRFGFEQEMKSILNPQQFEKWQKIRAKRVKTVKENTKDKKNAKTEVIETDDIF